MAKRTILATIVVTVWVIVGNLWASRHLVTGDQQVLSQRSQKMVEVNSITIQASVDSGRSPDSTIELEIVLTNNRPAPILWGHVDGFLDCNLQVVDASRQYAPVTSKGRGKLNRDPLAPTFKCVSRPLGPGETKRWSFMLNELLALRPGKYFVDASIIILDVPGMSAITVKEMEFDVAAP